MDSLKKQFTHGVFFNAAAKYSGIIIQLVVTAILARLLSPDEFGIIAICTVAIAFFYQFTDMGIGVAIVQRQDLDENDYNHLFSFTIYLGCFLSILFIIGSFYISEWYVKPDLRIYLQILSLQLLFSSFNAVPNAILLKRKQFRFLAERSISLQLITGFLSCIAAYSGWGCYSLLINPVLSSFGLFIINRYKIKLRYNLIFSLEPLKKIFSYSFYKFAFDLINYFSRNCFTTR